MADSLPDLTPPKPTRSELPAEEFPTVLERAGRFLRLFPVSDATKNQALAALRHFFDVLLSQDNPVQEDHPPNQPE